MEKWTIADIPSQRGKYAVVTGATGGLGLETARALAGAGAEVVIASRDAARGAQAVADIRCTHPGAAVRFEPLDLGSLGSVRACAQRLIAAGRPIDILVDNAGIMALPRRELTEDGFERQIGTNYFGHFALTTALLGLLRGGRVVTLASLAATRGRIVLGDTQAATDYRPMVQYSQTKLAMLMFAQELQRRSATEGWGLTAIAAHPGWSITGIVANGPGFSGIWRLAWPMMRLAGQSAADGARPILFAATSPAAVGGGYYGPAGLGELRGPPVAAKVPPTARDLGVSSALWDESVRLVSER